MNLSQNGQQQVALLGLRVVVRAEPGDVDLSLAGLPKRSGLLAFAPNAAKAVRAIIFYEVLIEAKRPQ